MLERAHYLRELQSSLRQFPAVALFGPRQVGKTTLARALSGKTKSVFLDLERQSDRSKLIDPEAFFKDHTKELIIIDEVQHIPELFTHLRPAIDEHRQPGRFLLLGSASPALVKGVSESLAGRIRYLELPPITLTEAEKNNIDFNKLWMRGGFPLSLTASNNLSSLTWRQQLIHSFVERDLSLLFGIGISGNTVRNFWQMLAHLQGSLFNAQALGLSLGVSGVTVRRYLDFLEGAYLVRILQPWFVNASKRLVKSPKVYIRDSGLLHAFLNLQDKDSLLGHPIAGFSWEGFVIEQIIHSMPDNVRAFFYRTHHGAEADLVLVRGVTPIAAIEIKLTNAPIVSRGFYQAIEDLSVDKGFLITPGSDTYSQRNVRVTNVRHFIEKILPAL
jgi:predicted AAA+ superfamily ATPase